MSAVMGPAHSLSKNTFFLISIHGNKIMVLKFGGTSLLCHMVNGKGPVDGLGGSVKRSVWRHVKSGMSRIENAKEYAMVAKKRNPNIHIEYVAQAEINDNYEVEIRS